VSGSSGLELDTMAEQVGECLSGKVLVLLFAYRPNSTTITHDVAESSGKQAVGK
jgi:hypothetical protein